MKGLNTCSPLLRLWNWKAEKIASLGGEKDDESI